MQDQVTEEIKRHKETFDPASESRDFIDEYLKKILELKDCDEKHLYTGDLAILLLWVVSVRLELWRKSDAFVLFRGSKNGPFYSKSLKPVLKLDNPFLDFFIHKE